MKKLLICILSVIAALSFTLFGVGCIKDNNGSKTPESTATLNTTSVRLILGESYNLTATYSEEDWAVFSWTSSNDAVATVDSYGVVRSSGLGTATITATYNGVSATCAVDVVTDTLVPTIYAKHSYGNAVNATVGGEYIFEYSIMFNQNLYENGKFMFDSSDTSVGTIDANGKFTALAKGQTTITVEGSWYDNGYSSLIDVITVNVVDDVRINVNGGSTSKVLLYTVADHNGQTFAVESDFIVEIDANGQEVSADDYTIEVENADVVTYADNKVTALKDGETLIKITYGEYYREVPVEVTFPVTNYKYGTLDFSAHTGELDIDGIFGKTGVTLVSAYQGETELTIEDNKIFGLTLSRTEWTDTRVTLMSDVEGFIVDLKAAEMIIDEAEEFVEYFTLTDEDVTAKKVYGGYVVLADDIVIDTQLAHSSSISSGTTSAGFAGVFDGQGHKITAPVGTNGLFGSVYSRLAAEWTYIRNTNFDLTANASGARALYAGKGNFASTRRIQTENCYIKVSGETANFYGIQSNDNYTLNIVNCIIDLSELNAKAGYAFNSAWDSNIIVSSIPTRKNVFVISDLPFAYRNKLNNGTMPSINIYAENTFDAADGTVYVHGMEFDFVTTYKYKATGFNQYSAMDEFVADAARFDFSAFNSDMWEFITGIPTIKTDPYVLTVDGLNKAPISIIKGETATISLKHNGERVPFTAVSNNPSVATIEGGVISAIGNGDIIATVTYDYNGQSIVKEIPVKVGQVIEVAEEIEFSALDGDLDLQAILGEDYTEDATVTAVYRDGKALQVENNKIIGFETANDAITYATVLVFTSENTYRVNLKAYRQIIDSAADFAQFNNVDGKNKLVSGYYILKHDISLDEDIDPNTDGVQKVDLSHTALREWSNSSTYSDLGFDGTFDGNGYKITGSAPRFGIFGAICSPAVIKNVSFEMNVVHEVTAIIAYGGAHAPTNSASVNIENVYAKPIGSVNNYVGLFGRTSCWVISKNVLIDMSELTMAGTSSSSGAYAFSSFNANEYFRYSEMISVGDYYVSGRDSTDATKAYKYLGKNETSGLTEDTTVGFKAGQREAQSGSGKDDSSIYRYKTYAALAGAMTTAESYGKKYSEEFWDIVEYKDGDTVIGYIPVWVGNANA